MHEDRANISGNEGEIIANQSVGNRKRRAEEAI